MLSIIILATGFVFSTTAHELLIAINQGNSAAVETCLKNPDIDINQHFKHGITALHLAASKGLLTITKQLINAGASPFVQSDDGSTPLLFASLYNQPNVAQYLFKKAKPTVNIHNQMHVSPLHGLVAHGHTSIVREIIPHIRLPHIQESHGVTPFMVAVHLQNRAMITLLLPYFLRHLDKSDLDGRTALFATIYNGNAELADILIRHGANQNHTSHDGTTPLLLAVKTNQVEMCNLLLRQNVNIQAVNSQGENALILAVKNGNIALIRLFTWLINNINHQDAQGSSALEHATIRNNIEAVNILMTHPQIEPNTRNLQGKTPGDIALALNLRPIVDILGQFSDTSLDNIYDQLGISTPLVEDEGINDSFFKDDTHQYFFLDGLE